ncbi:hypothetical protein NG798_24760 [Ancylothrix sp. C2]|nr:hypothetical protein [Ancylothrix sp. D3o]MCT7953014.1 hypothetical protein [Ancylothrix sp. D3o]
MTKLRGHEKPGVSVQNFIFPHYTTPAIQLGIEHCFFCLTQKFTLSAI